MNDDLKNKLVEMFPIKLAERAYYNNSFDSEKMAKREREDFVNVVEGVFEMCVNFAPGRLEEINIDIDIFAEKYLKKIEACLYSMTRTASAMIVGCGNFPVARMEKRQATVMKRLDDIAFFTNNFKKNLTKKYKKQEKKTLDPLIEDASVYNNYLLKASLERKILNYAKESLEQASEIKESLSSGKLSKIFTARHSIHQKIDKIIQDFSTVLDSYTFGDVKIIKNNVENRIQIFLKEKPCDELRTALKKNQFKWTQSKGCWQNWNNPRNLKIALSLFEALKH